MLARLRRLRKARRLERIARILDGADPEAAGRWRHATSDAGEYLLERARSKGHVSDLLERAADVEASIERTGAWDEYNEWRIGTVSTNRIERAGLGYRATTECDGVYAATVGSISKALEAIQVLSALQRDLFYEVGWASWAGRRQMTPGVGEMNLDDAEGDELYLARISREAVRDEVARSSGTKVHRTSVDWLDGPAYEVVVKSGNLSMTCVSPTMERASQFAGIFRAVQDDIAGLFDWS
jgi:hypothetical protein